MSTVVTDRALSSTYGCIDHKAPLQHDGEQKNSTMFFFWCYMAYKCKYRSCSNNAASCISKGHGGVSVDMMHFEGWHHYMKDESIHLVS